VDDEVHCGIVIGWREECGGHGPGQGSCGAKEPPPGETAAAARDWNLAIKPGCGKGRSAVHG
jgi:hypothetical protein